jgi:hypothetical protein
MSAIGPAFCVLSTGRPWMRRISTTMIATTKRMWMNPLTVYDVIIPSNHIARSMTTKVQSIVTFLS